MDEFAPFGIIIIIIIIIVVKELATFAGNYHFKRNGNGFLTYLAQQLRR